MASRRQYPIPPYPVTPPAEPDPSESPFTNQQQQQPMRKSDEMISPISPNANTNSLPPPLPPKLPAGNTGSSSRNSGSGSSGSPHYYSHYAQQQQQEAVRHTQQQQRVDGRVGVTGGNTGSPPPPPKNPARPAYVPPQQQQQQQQQQPPRKQPSPPVPPRLSQESHAHSSRPSTAAELSGKEDDPDTRRRKRKDTVKQHKDRDKTSDVDRRRRHLNSRRTRLRLLALDGGGIRGYSTLLLLESLMHDVFVELHGRPPKRGEEVTKPCEVFDLICGTGTGGLIAIMLGRLRMSVATCKEVYVRMTRYVFETDKRVIGIPYGDTLFKASKLERAIKEVVRERSKDDGREIPEEYWSEGEDWDLEPMGGAYDDEKEVEADIERVSTGSYHGRTDSIKGIADASRLPSLDGGGGGARRGNENALMHDKRKGRCKTFVTAVYKGSNKDSTPAYLRTYSSGVESMSYPDCKIWQAGRATSATLAAFKEIKISQDVFLDEGHGKYNPTPQVLEEALVNEWPGRDVGVIISLGTGKRPPNAQKGDNKVQWWENLSSSLDVFTQARRRLMAKIDDCENIHQTLLKDGLAMYNVSTSRYFRFNVDTGVGEVAMNEWSRLSEVSTATRVYLANHDVNGGMKVAARKLGKITLDKQRRRMEREVEKFDSTASSVSGPVYEMPAESYVNEPEGMTELPATEVKPNMPSLPPPPPVPGIRITPPTVKYPHGTRPVRKNESNGKVELPG